MGAIADSMINGEFCEACGVFLDGESPGFPRYCSQECANDKGADSSQVVSEMWDFLTDEGDDEDDDY